MKTFWWRSSASPNCHEICPMFHPCALAIQIVYKKNEDNPLETKWRQHNGVVAGLPAERIGGVTSVERTSLSAEEIMDQCKGNLSSSLDQGKTSRLPACA